MIINIDYREKKLIEKINSCKDSYPNISVVVKNLHIGDIVFSQNENMPNEDISGQDNISYQDVLIFERKSVSDLASSIRDGRYNEQSMRLNANELHNHNIVYLIEGKITSYKPRPGKNPVTQSAIYSSICSMHYFKGFSVLRTDNVDETGIMLLQMADKIYRETAITNSKCKKPYYNSNINSGAEQSVSSVVGSYISCIKQKKKDNISPENIGEIMLCQIPGLGPSVAKAIMQHYETIADLINDLSNDPKCLDNIIYSAGVKHRHIGKKTVEKLKYYFKITSV